MRISLTEKSSCHIGNQTHDLSTNCWNYCPIIWRINSSTPLYFFCTLLNKFSKWPCSVYIFISKPTTQSIYMYTWQNFLFSLLYSHWIRDINIEVEGPCCFIITKHLELSHFVVKITSIIWSPCFGAFSKLCI